MQNPIRELCRDMANNPVALTFSDLAQAAATGVSIGQKTGSLHGVWIGGVLGVSLEAGKRAVEITESMLAGLIKNNKNAALEPKESKTKSTSTAKNSKPKNKK